MLSFHHFSLTLFCYKLGFFCFPPLKLHFSFSLNMGCGYFFISFLFLLILSTTQLGFKSEGRPNPKFDNFAKTVSEEDKMMLRAQIGSKPPRCERRCSSCSHCEAIQVPTNSQVRSGKGNFAHSSNVAYARGDDYSNYKPLSWKCKCGNLIFNP